MTTALANVKYKPTELTTERLGAVLVKSGFFADARDEAQAIVKILAGAELGFGPIASMQGVYIVKGRVTLSANLVGAAIQRSGKYGYAIEALTNDKCTLRFYNSTQQGAGLPRQTFESTFTMDDAKKAGLAGGNYDKFSRNMLFARALTNGARWFCPEVFNGPIYTPDELGAEVDDEGRVIEISGEAVPYVPTREQDPDEPRADALGSWAEVCGEADRLQIKHKDLPDNATVEQIERWTVALMDRINEANVSEDAAVPA